MTPEQVSKFEEDGFLVIQDFLTNEEVDLLKAECAKLVDELEPEKHKSIFITGVSQKTDDYFLDSGDKIRCFFEKDAVDEEGNLVVEKQQSLNKIGHALHMHGIFKKVTFSGRVKNIAKSLGFLDPVVLQGMYIFKNPKLGAEGSHKGEVYKRFVRHPEQKAILITVTEPSAFDESEMVPVPVPKGSCVIIHGKVLHKSEKNLSDKPRPAYTFHIIETKDTKYSKENWIQLPSDGKPFPSLYTTSE